MWSLLTLPKDVLYIILELIDIRSLFTIGYTCKTLKRRTSGNDIWIPRVINLFPNGYIDEVMHDAECTCRDIVSAHIKYLRSCNEWESIIRSWYWSRYIPDDKLLPLPSMYVALHLRKKCKRISGKHIEFFGKTKLAAMAIVCIKTLDHLENMNRLDPKGKMNLNNPPPYRAHDKKKKPYRKVNMMSTLNKRALYY